VRISTGERWQVTTDIGGNSDTETLVVGLHYLLNRWERSR